MRKTTIMTGVTKLQVALDRMETNQARAEAKLDTANKGILKTMADLDDLTAAVTDNIAAQSESFAAQVTEDANIETAITQLGQTLGTNPAVQAQITAIRNASAARRAATVSAQAENIKLANAVGVAPPPPIQ